MISATTGCKAESDGYSLFTEPCGLRTTDQGPNPVSSRDIICLFLYFPRKRAISEADGVTFSPHRAQRPMGWGCTHRVGLWALSWAVRPPTIPTHCAWGSQMDPQHPENASLLEKSLLAFGPLEGSACADASSGAQQALRL